jgi:hypothetical protein
MTTQNGNTQIQATAKTLTLVCMNGGFVTAEASAITPDFTPPEGFSSEGGNRKFIVLADDKGSLVLVIGPVMDEYYFHKNILRRVRGQFQGLEISGDGDLKVAWSSYEKKWTLKFGGSSGDFGVYDYRLLAKEVRAALADQLGLPCHFEWRG